MYELLPFLACLLIPFGVMTALIVWFIRRGNKASATPSDAVLIPALRAMLERWVAEQRLTAEEAAPVLRLLGNQLTPAVQIAPAAAAPAQPIPAAQVPTPPAAAVPVQPAVAAPAKPLVAAQAAPKTPALAKPVTPAAAPSSARPAEPSWAEKAWAGLLALRTRQLLLFLGAFLLLMSSLVLVVFNWENFPPLLQCALLASVCGALWGLGELAERSWKVPQAAAGLRAVSGVLMPVVAFAITRLLEMELHSAWLLVSLISLPLYVLAVWRTRQRLFGVAASLAGVSAAAAACGFVSWPAVPAVLCLLLAVYLPLGRRLHSQVPEFAQSLRWVAHVGTPAALAIAGTLASAGLLGFGALGASFGAGALFYGVAAWLEGRVTWTWAASVLAPAGLLSTAASLFPDRWSLWSLALIGLCVLYSLIAARLRPTQPKHAQPFYALAHLLAPSAFIVGTLLGWGNTDATLVLWAGFGFYLAALFQERLPQWSMASALACSFALGVTLYAHADLAGRTLMLALLGLMAAYLLLARWLRSGHWNALALGPWSVAHVGAPLILAAMLPNLAPRWSDVTLWWAGVGFYVLALVLERRTWWLWPALGIVPIALAATGVTLAIDSTLLAAGLGVLALGYILGGTSIEPRHRPFALPGYVVGVVLGMIVGGLALLDGSRALQLTLPSLLIACAVLVAATHRGRFGWLSATEQSGLGALALTIFALLLPAWLWVVLSNLETPWRAVALLPLAAVAFAAARWWPGNLRPIYALALRGVAVVLAFGFTALAINNEDALLAALIMVTATWAFQTILQRNIVWAFLAMAAAVNAAGWALIWSDAGEGMWLAVAVLFVAGYTLTAERVRNTNWRCLVVPGILIGVWLGGLLVLYVLGTSLWRGAYREGVATVLALAALAAGHSALWRRAFLGYLAAPLLGLGVMLAASQQFFLPPPYGNIDYAFVLCGLTVVLVAIGEVVRRIALRFAYPYEQVGFALLVAAPILAGTEPGLAAPTWAMVAAMSTFATLRYRLNWALLPALLALDAALLFGAGWLAPGGTLADAAVLLVAAAWLQGLLGASIARWRKGLREPAYLALLITGAVALSFAATGGLAGGPLASVALGLALLAALLSTWERKELAAWGALGLLAIGLAALHAQLGITPEWSASLGAFEALLLLLVGWVLEILARRAPAQASFAAVWRRPLFEGMIVSAIGLVGFVVATVPPGRMSVVFALVMLAAVLATAAVQRRTITYAYGAGAALVAAALCQLVVLQVREVQWYIVPACVYLLALAEGLRRFQGQRQLSQVIEGGALALLLGTSAMQAVEADGYRAIALTTLLCFESLIVLAYGVLRRLKVPFVAGSVGFVGGVLWLGIDPLLAQNKWVLMGVLGLLLVGLYVLLERRQEQLVRAGRAWIERVSAWG